MILTISVNILVTILIITASSYLKEKGKNYATKEDIGKITQTIEGIKTSFELEKQKFMLALSSQSSSYHAADNKRVEAIEKTWSAFVKLADVSVPELFLYLEILSESEYEKHLLTNDPSIIKSLEKDVDKQHDEVKGIDSVRPFISEFLYALFFSFRAIRGRSNFLLIESKEKNKAILWSRDTSMVNLMKSVLTEQEIELINKTPVGKFGILRILFYGKALSEINKILSGHFAMESSIENAHQILETANESDIELFKKKKNEKTRS